ncbi:hypothetical protein AZ78_4467 [Lysobacter capsici AZ78]|uniref:Uncharacterized protein n=1 Tax=Lysobacter capsici AZ78 TaxID=1444315 RepID=A0A120AHY4_9GAMM|nr:hypothetical protein AZ78_4467 [Lysobacter capsici AZ78]
MSRFSRPAFVAQGRHAPSRFEPLASQTTQLMCVRVACSTGHR